MSLLPQRKKSAEEIAELRERLGIPGLPQESTEPVASEPVIDRIVSSTHEAKLEHPEPAVHIDPEPAAVAHSNHHVVHSLKRSERLSVMPEPASEPVALAESPESSIPSSGTGRAAKRVRSLRKSEQTPIPPPRPVTSQEDGLMPFHRHSDEELAEIRRRAALAQLGAPPPPNLSSAHPALIVLAYLTPAAAAVGIWFYRIPIAATASCLGAALLIAALIYLRNPYSRHHAAFIAISALFVAAFGALHYFPHLTFQHGP